MSTSQQKKDDNNLVEQVSDTSIEEIKPIAPKINEEDVDNDDIEDDEDNEPHDSENHSTQNNKLPKSSSVGSEKRMKRIEKHLATISKAKLAVKKIADELAASDKFFGMSHTDEIITKYGLEKLGFKPSDTLQISRLDKTEDE